MSAQRKAAADHSTAASQERQTVEQEPPCANGAMITQSAISSSPRLPEFPAARVWSRLTYNPDTGVLTWRRRPRSHFKSESAHGTWNTKHAGTEAGCVDSGYRIVGIDDVTYKAHRLIWLYVRGEWPDDQIDHINGDRLDNRLENLRVVSNAENSRNRKRASNNTSGVVGVFRDKTRGKWQAQIKVAGRRSHLGYYDDKDEAIAARRAAEVAHDFHPNHGRSAV